MATSTTTPKGKYTESLTFSTPNGIQFRTTKAHLFCGRGYSYLGHDRNNSGGSEMLENIYLECIEEIGTSRSS